MDPTAPSSPGQFSIRFPQECPRPAVLGAASPSSQQSSALPLFPTPGSYLAALQEFTGRQELLGPIPAGHGVGRGRDQGHWGGRRGDVAAAATASSCRGQDLCLRETQVDTLIRVLSPVAFPRDH